MRSYQFHIHITEFHVIITFPPEEGYRQIVWPEAEHGFYAIIMRQALQFYLYAVICDVCVCVKNKKEGEK